MTENLNEEIARLRELIARAEWVEGELDLACPWCDASTCVTPTPERPMIHAPDCPAAQAMGWRMRG